MTCARARVAHGAGTTAAEGGGPGPAGRGKRPRCGPLIRVCCPRRSAGTGPGGNWAGPKRRAGRRDRAPHVRVRPLTQKGGALGPGGLGVCGLHEVNRTTRRIGAMCNSMFMQLHDVMKFIVVA